MSQYGMPTRASSTPTPIRVTPRSFVIGLLLGLGMCAVMPYNDYFVGATYLSGNYFPIGGIAAVLLLVAVVNPVLITMGRRQRTFTPAEIITVWSLIVIVAGIPSSGMMRYLIPHIVAPTYFASPANGWDALFISHMPKRLIITDSIAVKGYFEGLKRGDSIPWIVWCEPLVWWSMFAGLMYVVFFAIATLVRRQWVENEHLTFPLVILPLFLAEAPEVGQRFPALFRNRLMWSAVLFVTVLHTIKGMHMFYPSIPDIPLIFYSSGYLKTPPLKAINDIWFAFYPLVIGFSYLLSSEVCFSLWFFYVVSKAQVLFAAVNALDLSNPGGGIVVGPGFLAYQEAGGSLIIAAWLVWSMRDHLQGALKHALGRGDVDDAHEAMSYRAAICCFVGGYVGLYAWLTIVAAIQPLMAIAVLVGSFVIFLVLGWLVAQAGMLFAQMSFAPSQVTAIVSPTGSFSPQSLVMGCMAEHIGWYDAREIMLPSVINSQRAAGGVNLSQRSLTKALVTAIVLAFAVAAAASIWLPYTHGGATSLVVDNWGYIAAPQKPFSWSASVLHARGEPAAGVLANMSAGALFVLAILAARNALPWFPIHPAGFLVAGTYPIMSMWFSLFVGWAIKTPLLRYAGIRGYQTYLPFFLGLILGDSMNAIVWTVVGLLTHTGYRLLPG